MPPRRRRKGKQTSVDELDPVTRFGTMLREAAERERADQQRAEQQRRHDEELVAAKAELDAAIEAARRARSTGNRVAEADAAWRAAKARVIELETGEPPSWWTPTDDDPAAAAPDPADDEPDGTDDSA